MFCFFWGLDFYLALFPQMQLGFAVAVLSLCSRAGAERFG